MTKFGIKISVFSLIVIGLILAVILTLNWVIKKREPFKMPDKYTGIIIGNSHAATGFDDEYLPGFKNLGRVTETYLFSYIKIREILASNQEIKTILLEFDNLQIHPDSVNKMLYGPHFNKFMPIYQPFLSPKELSVYFGKVPEKMLSNQRRVIKRGWEVLFEQSYNFIEGNLVGSNSRLKGSFVDAQIKGIADKGKSYIANMEVHDSNMKYLKMIITLCKQKEVRLVLVRAPMVPSFSGLLNEKTFQQVVRNDLSEVPFIDLQHFPLGHEDFNDLHHTNTLGTGKISQMMNKAIIDGLFEQDDMQAFINARIDSLR